MKKYLILFCLILIAFPAFGATRIKDIANIEGVRGNQLYGYGIVVGLNGTGDKQQTIFTQQSLTEMLKKMNITPSDKIKVENVAAVLVTAELPPFVRAGSRIDITLSSIGDCESLQGGTLVLTPLQGPDGNVYAVAQGPVSIGGFAAGGGGGSSQKNHPTVGLIPNGAIIEEEVSMNIIQDQKIKVCLKSPDFTTASRMAESINKVFEDSAKAVDAGCIEINVSKEITDNNNLVDFISKVEQLQLTTDSFAKIIVNERTGTIIAGENVRISTVAIAHGNLVITIREKVDVDQPDVPLAGGETVVTEEQEVTVEEKKARLIVLNESVSIKDVASALNAIGVSPRDMISIFQAMKRANALKADLEIM
ncbi:MAG: flagellar basal body P-ring protein FlgI [Candidatus Aureabacteria bacterium]|nr:flagellar basal body P-ring protein FlgI [Candidatus Auribacterota bacterium]